MECVTERHYQEFLKSLLEQKIQKLETESTIRSLSGAKKNGYGNTQCDTG